MQFNPHLSEERQRRYSFLSFFDVTLNLVLCSGIFALGCALLGIALSHNAPYFVLQVSQVASQIMG